MFAGHIGAGLALGSVERKVNVGALIAAALLLDMVLWVLVLFGFEKAIIPTNYAATHQLAFIFPYSHSLLASIIWSLLAASIALLKFSRSSIDKFRAAALIAAAVFSHWILDFIVHQPEMPLTGAGSSVVGLGLWNDMPLALILESLVTITGLWLFVRSSGLSRARLVGIAIVTVLTLAFTVVGMTLAPTPPSVSAVAGSSLLTILVICGLMLWLGKVEAEPNRT